MRAPSRVYDIMNVVVTGGGTIAPIDDVRQITNASSGRFSAAIAEACLDRGAEVWHVHAPGALLPFARHATLDPDAEPDAELDRLADLGRRWRAARGHLHLVPLAVGTVADYARSLEGVIRRQAIDVAFLAMAASDFEPEPVAGKIDSGAAELVLRCRPAPKVIRRVRDWAPDAYLVGFKLLSGAGPAELIRAAEAAGQANRADLTVANDLRAYRAGRHAIHLVRPGHPAETFGPGGPLADHLVERAFAWAKAR